MSVLKLVLNLVLTVCRIMAHWLHQFWYFAYKTAKHWGRGPRSWNALELNFPILRHPTVTPIDSPQAFDSNVGPFVEGRRKADGPSDSLPMPSSICRWSVHCSPNALVWNDDIDTLPSGSSNSDQVDPMNESTWKDWPSAWWETPYHQQLTDGLESNDFSTVGEEELPVSLSQLSSGDHQKKSIREDSLGFAIMAGNIDLVSTIARDLSHDEVEKLYPLHLATSYLNGAKTCCLVFDSLLARVPSLATSSNHLGHTVLDNLMLTVLRSHTSLAPGDIDPALKGSRRFPGEEVDICGRWDVDSNCYRQLVSTGHVSIPFRWKHKFCHTSVQAICHCMTTFTLRNSRVMSRKSNLFTQYCGRCGLKLQLSLPHLIVVIAVKLAESGCADEDLFGVIAVLLQVLQIDLPSPLGTDCDYLPFDLSYDTLSSETNADPTNCHHRKMDAFEFANSMPSERVQRWPIETQLGWKVICHVLRVTHLHYHNLIGDKRVGEVSGCEHGLLRRDQQSAKLWGAVQAEFLTYRRFQESDPWLSPNFSMQAVVDSFDRDVDLSAGPLTDIPLMKDVCDCGLFDKGFDYPTSEDVSTEYISNLGNDYERLQIIQPPSTIMEVGVC